MQRHRVAAGVRQTVEAAEKYAMMSAMRNRGSGGGDGFMWRCGGKFVTA